MMQKYTCPPGIKLSTIAPTKGFWRTLLLWCLFLKCGSGHCMCRVKSLNHKWKALFYVKSFSNNNVANKPLAQWHPFLALQCYIEDNSPELRLRTRAQDMILPTAWKKLWHLQTRNVWHFSVTTVITPALKKKNI